MRAARVAIADVLRIEAKYSRYRDDSVTAAINRAAGGAAGGDRRRDGALLRYADRCHALSGGALRPDVGRAAARVGFPAPAAADSDAMTRSPQRAN